MTPQKILPLVALAAGILAVFSYRFAKEEVGVSPTAPVVVSPQEPSKETTTSQREKRVMTAVSAPVAPVSDETRAPINERPGHTMASIDLISAMMRHRELDLSKDEMEQLLTAYLAVVDNRSKFEASIAKVEVVSPRERNIVIPPYQQEGLEMQAALYRIFASILGSERGSLAKEALEGELYFRNFGFGESEQTINVKLGEVVIPEIHYEITHGVAAIHAQVRDDSGNPRDTSLTVKGARSVLPASDLSAYAGLAEFFPPGGAGS